MADILLSKHSNPTPQQNIGINWVSNFLRQNKDLKTCYLCCYNYQHIKCKDLKLIREFFEAFYKTVIDYGISNNNIYNFNEIGFTIGIIATMRVIIMSDNIGKPVVLQPGNQE
jgi:hypothetical protein